LLDLSTSSQIIPRCLNCLSEQTCVHRLSSSTSTTHQFTKLCFQRAFIRAKPSEAVTGGLRPMLAV